MITQNLNQNSAIASEIQELKFLEGELARKISPLLLDYMFIFAPDISYDLNIKTLNPTAIQIITKYINVTDSILNKVGIPAEPKSQDILQDLATALHDMYLLRYTSAKPLFAEYELYRIPTQFEVKINTLSKQSIANYTEMPSFKLPEGLIINEDGDIDWPATLQDEKVNHKLARYVSAYKKATIFGQQMFIDLQAITTKGLAYTIFKKDIQALIEEVLIQATFHFSNDTHKYIDQNYSLQEALTNVYAYYKAMAAKGNNYMMGALSQFFTEIRTTIMARLDPLKDLTAETKAAILDDFLELLIAYIKADLLLPKDYYAVIMRDDTNFYENEQGHNYRNLLDFYLHIPEGGFTQMAMETFNVDFSREAKFFIFQNVVGDNQNPKLTLKTYLEGNNGA